VRGNLKEDRRYNAEFRMQNGGKTASGAEAVFFDL
jgi:hypothetical protein